MDLRQVSVQYFTSSTGTYKNSNKGFVCFLNILDVGIPLMQEKTLKWLLNFFIYLKSNLSIILSGRHKCSITNAPENGFPSDNTLDMFIQFSCTAAINVVFQYIVSARVINLCCRSD